MRVSAKKQAAQIALFLGKKKFVNPAKKSWQKPYECVKKSAGKAKTTKFFWKPSFGKAEPKEFFWKPSFGKTEPKEFYWKPSLGKGKPTKFFWKPSFGKWKPTKFWWKPSFGKWKPKEFLMVNEFVLILHSWFKRKYNSKENKNPCNF